MKRGRYLLTALVGVALFVGGWTIPTVFVGDRVEVFRGQEGDFAGYAVRSARQLLGGSLEPLIVTGIRVRSVALRSDALVECGGEAPMPTMSRDFRAIVTVHTWWGIPYKRLQVTCGDVQPAGVWPSL